MKKESEEERRKRIEELAALDDADWAGDCERREYKKSEEYAKRKKLAEEFAKRKGKS
jgi:hypothetical protein